MNVGLPTIKIDADQKFKTCLYHIKELLWLEGSNMGDDYVHPFSKEMKESLKVNIQPLPKIMKESMIEKDGKIYIEAEQLSRLLHFMSTMRREEYEEICEGRETDMIKEISRCIWNYTLHIGVEKMIAEFQGERLTNEFTKNSDSSE
jgi:hypothetical protein